MKSKELLPIFKNKKFVKIITPCGEWIIFKQSDFPFYFSTAFGNLELIHRHNSYQNYHFQNKTEWVTPSGIRHLINYIKSHDFNTGEPDTIKDEELNIKPTSFIDIINELPYDRIINNIEEDYNRDMEFTNIEVPESITDIDEIDNFTQEKLEEESNNKKQEYLDIVRKYSNYISKEIMKEICNKINSL